MLLIATTFYVAKFFISGNRLWNQWHVYTRDTADVISSLKSPSPNNDSPWHCLIPPPVLFIFSGRCYWLRIILYKLGLFCGCCVLSSLWVFFLLLLQIWSRTSVALLKFVYTNSTYTGIRSVIWHQLEPLYNRKQRWVYI